MDKDISEILKTKRDVGVYRDTTGRVYLGVRADAPYPLVLEPHEARDLAEQLAPPAPVVPDKLELEQRALVLFGSSHSVQVVELGEEGDKRWYAQILIGLPFVGPARRNREVAQLDLELVVSVLWRFFRSGDHCG